MKYLIVLCSVVVMTFALPTEVREPLPEEAPAFHFGQTSDVDGSYHFTYAGEDSSRTETRQPDGTIIGGYQYIDTDGVLQKAQYKGSAEEGFQILASNLPVGTTEPVNDTPEVIKATEEHYHLVQKALQDIARAAAFEEEYRRLHPELAEKH